LPAACDHARHATRLAPEDPLFWLQRGRREPNPAVQVVCLTEAIRLSQSADAYKERAYAFSHLGCYEAARDDFLRADDRAAGYGTPSVEAERMAARLAAEGGRPGSADTLAAALVARVTLPPPAGPTAAGRVAVVLLLLFIVAAGILGAWVGAQ
jgi:hypothetical protein